MTENELYHHGILGMKWGVRRYQNADGSLTSAGRARYGVSDQKNALSSYRTRMKNARIARKARDSSIQKRYDEGERLIEKGYKRGQLLSKEDQAKENALDQRSRDDWAKSKAQYKADKAAARQELKENFKLTEGQKKALKIGLAVAGTALATYGAYKIGGKLLANAAYKQTMNHGSKYVDEVMRGIGVSVASKRDNVTSYNSSMLRGYRQRLTNDLEDVARNNSSNVRNSIATLRGKRRGNESLAEFLARGKGSNEMITVNKYGDVISDDIDQRIANSYNEYARKKPDPGRDYRHREVRLRRTIY